VRTALLAIIAFLPTKGDGALASLDWSPEERRKLAKSSLSYSCATCGCYNLTALPPEDEQEQLDAKDIEGISIKTKEQQEQDEKDSKKPPPTTSHDIHNDNQNILPNSNNTATTVDGNITNQTNNLDRDQPSDLFTPVQLPTSSGAEKGIIRLLDYAIAIILSVLLYLVWQRVATL